MYETGRNLSFDADSPVQNPHTSRQFRKKLSGSILWSKKRCQLGIEQILTLVNHWANNWHAQPRRTRTCVSFFHAKRSKTSWFVQPFAIKPWLACPPIIFSGAQSSVHKSKVLHGASQSPGSDWNLENPWSTSLWHKKVRFYLLVYFPVSTITLIISWILFFLMSCTSNSSDLC